MENPREKGAVEPAGERLAPACEGVGERTQMALAAVRADSLFRLAGLQGL